MPVMIAWRLASLRPQYSGSASRRKRIQSGSSSKNWQCSRFIFGTEGVGLEQGTRKLKGRELQWG
eukprot:1890960-Rhodomonas_salina.1